MNLLNHTVITLQPGQIQRVATQRGQHYKLRAQGSVADVPDPLIATRQGNALQVRYADGSTVVFDDFYANCTDATVCSVQLAANTPAGVTLAADSATGTVPTDGGTLVYAHGAHDVLMSMAQGHLLGIINDILDFSKIESGKMEIEAVPFDLESVIDNMVNLVSQKVDAKGLELLCQVRPDVPHHLVGDPLRIGQVLINLVNNAVKFTEKGEVRLHISVKETSGEQALIAFKVIDTGIGMTPEHMARMFHSFEQADTSITRRYGGSGLGLVICKSLAQAMGGDIDVESEFGRGSTFSFTARLGLGGAAKSTRLQDIDIHGARVLVVDDNEAAAMVMADTLSQLGFAVDQTHSGKGALAKLRDADFKANPYVFVMMDWLMPGMDGLETVKAIRALHNKTSPFVMMVTAHRRHELIKGAEQLGIAHVLAKPVSGSVLVNTMMQIMGHAKTEPERVMPLRSSNPLEAELVHIRGARVLLVEDNEINQLVATETLQLAGFAVDLAENGQIAVAQAAARASENLPYDIVLMDMQMPVMDGVTATRLIRENYSAQELPIVAMTANAMQADRDRCMDAGMNDFVTKPINPDELWRAMLTWVKVREGMGPAAHVPAPSAVAPRTEDAERTAKLMDALRALPGLNATLGLMRSTDNPAFYTAMLRKFVAGQADTIVRAQAALAGGDRATAERIAHTLKGVAGNLGATAVQAAAAALESALRDGAAPQEVTEALQHTDTALQHLLSGLTTVPGLLPDGPEARATPPADTTRQAALQRIAQISELLQADDPAAVELWETHAESIKPWLPNATAIEKAITVFAFEEALGLLPPHNPLADT